MYALAFKILDDLLADLARFSAHKAELHRGLGEVQGWPPLRHQLKWNPYDNLTGMPLYPVIKTGLHTP